MKPKSRFLITGDLHVHNFRQFAKTLPSGLNSRLHNCLNVFDIILREAKSRRIDKVILNGDIFHEADEIDTEVYGEVYKKLERLADHGIDTNLILGNHDTSLCTSQRLVHSLFAFRKVARVIEKPTTLWDSVSAIPWTANTVLYRQWLKTAALEKPRRVLVTHVGITEGRIGQSGIRVKGQVRLADLHPEGFHLVLLSDYHHRQKVADHVYYLGSPLHHNFGETHEPVIWEIQTLGQEPWYLRRAIPTHLPQFVSLQKESLQLDDIRDRFAIHRGSYFRIRTSRDEAQIQSLAEKYGCQVEIERASKEKEEDDFTKRSFSLEESIDRYADRFYEGRLRRWIVRLGKKLSQK
jgi:DNA repair exonuclease SbcCD nuclease subunit